MNATTGSGPDNEPPDWSGVRRGPLQPGEWVRLVDGKGRRHNICLEPGKSFHTNRGGLSHDDIIGREEGFTLTSTSGGEYLVFRPLLSEFVVSMPRGAAVVYPKDAAQIVAMADIFPGARVVEAGAGSGALTCSLLRAVGPAGHVSSYERREEFADVARRNVTQFFANPDGLPHPAWTLTVGDLVECLPAGERARQRRPGRARHARALGVRRRRGRRAGRGRHHRRVRRDHHPAGAHRGDPARTRGVHRAAALGDPRSRLARRGTRRTTGAHDEGAHRVPGHRPEDGSGQRSAQEEASSGTRCLRSGLRGSPTGRPSRRASDPEPGPVDTPRTTLQLGPAE